MGEENGGVFSIWRARCLSESGSSRASTEGTALYSASLVLPPPPLPLCVLMRSQHLAAVYHHVELRSRACDDFLEGDSVV